MQSKALNDTNTLINTENEEKTESTTKITQEDIEKQEETFGINSFIQNSKQYTGDFFENIDINEILNSAIKGEIDNTTIQKNTEFAWNRSTNRIKKFSMYISNNNNT